MPPIHWWTSGIYTTLGFVWHHCSGMFHCSNWINWWRICWMPILNRLKKKKSLRIDLLNRALGDGFLQTTFFVFERNKLILFSPLRLSHLFPLWFFSLLPPNPIHLSQPSTISPSLPHPSHLSHLSPSFLKSLSTFPSISHHLSLLCLFFLHLSFCL